MDKNIIIQIDSEGSIHIQNGGKLIIQGSPKTEKEITFEEARAEFAEHYATIWMSMDEDRRRESMNLIRDRDPAIYATAKILMMQLRAQRDLEIQKGLADLERKIDSEWAGELSKFGMLGGAPKPMGQPVFPANSGFSEKPRPDGFVMIGRAKVSVAHSYILFFEESGGIGKEMNIDVLSTEGDALIYAIDQLPKNMSAFQIRTVVADLKSRYKTIGNLPGEWLPFINNQPDES